MSIAGGCTSPAHRPTSARSSTTSVVAPRSSSAPTPETVVALPCDDAILTADDPSTSDDELVVFGRVALPTQTLGLPSSSNDSSGRLFAKQGLVIKPATSFELIVPDEWRGFLTIGWGSPARRSTHLQVSDCRPQRVGGLRLLRPVPPDKWFAYAGGYWVPRAACVSLLVKTVDETQRVQIGIGTPCH